MKEKEQIVALIARDFDLTQGAQAEQLSEEALTDYLANEIGLMLERNIENLFSILYRLDINENKVREAMSPLAAEPANIALAKLVIERQKQRLATKANIRPEKLDDDWSW